MAKTPNRYPDLHIDGNLILGGSINGNAVVTPAEVQANTDHRNDSNNPHTVTLAQLGLANGVNVLIGDAAAFAGVAGDTLGRFYYVTDTKALWWDTGAGWERVAAAPDATTTVKGLVEFAENNESAGNLAVQANDDRLSDNRAPTTHAGTHAEVGGDPITITQNQVTGLATALGNKVDTSHINDTGAHASDKISYDNGVSGLAASEVKTALDLVADAASSAQATASAAIPASEKDDPLGVPTLDGSGLIKANQLPIDVMSYKGSWDADNNTPDLTVLVYGPGASVGDFFLCAVAGDVDLGGGLVSYALNDRLIWNGSDWDHVPYGGTGGTHTHPISEIQPFTKALLDGKIEHVLHSTGPNEYGLVTQQNAPIPATARISLEVDNLGTWEKRYANAEDLVISLPPQITTVRSATLKSPGNTEDLTVLFTDISIQITEIHAIVRGTAPSANWALKYGTAAERDADTGTTIGSWLTTDPGSYGTLTDTGLSVTVPADRYIWLTTTGVSNTDELSVHVVFNAVDTQGTDANALHLTTDGELAAYYAAGAPANQKATLANEDLFFIESPADGNATKITRFQDIQASLSHDNLPDTAPSQHRIILEDTVDQLGSYPAANHSGSFFFGEDDLVLRRSDGIDWLATGIAVDDLSIEVGNPTLPGQEVIQLKGLAAAQTGYVVKKAAGGGIEWGTGGGGADPYYDTGVNFFGQQGTDETYDPANNAGRFAVLSDANQQYLFYCDGASWMSVKAGLSTIYFAGKGLAGRSSATPGTGGLITVPNSVQINSSVLELDGDAASPGGNKYYGTNSGGTKGYHDLPSGGGVPASIGTWKYESAGPGFDANGDFITTVGAGASTLVCANITRIHFRTVTADTNALDHTDILSKLGIGTYFYLYNETAGDLVPAVFQATSNGVFGSNRYYFDVTHVNVRSGSATADLIDENDYKVVVIPKWIQTSAGDTYQITWSGGMSGVDGNVYKTFNYTSGHNNPVLDGDVVADPYYTYDYMGPLVSIPADLSRVVLGLVPSVNSATTACYIDRVRASGATVTADAIGGLNYLVGTINAGQWNEWIIDTSGETNKSFSRGDRIGFRFASSTAGITWKINLAFEFWV